MKDYTGLTISKKIEIGNTWLLKNDIKDIKIVRKMITINDNTTSKRKVGYGIDWLKVNEEGEINSVNLYTDSSFEGIIKMIQIEYRLDNSPKI